MKKFLIAALFCYIITPNILASQISVPISDLEEFSWMSKNDILKKRQEAIETSPLIDLIGNDYTPNPEVFQIEDNAPWIGAYEISCYGEKGNNKISEGVSRDSLGILNPELLLYTEVLAYHFSDKGNGCSPVDYLIPYYVEYDSDKRLITAHIDYIAFFRKNKSFYNVSLMDANAHDLGYNYIFAEIDKKNKADDFMWKSSKNVANSVVRTKGYYHFGTNVCQGLGGCNNYSPAQPEYDFRFIKLPFEVCFKLWKNKPNSPEDEADIYYCLIFE